MNLIDLKEEELFDIDGGSNWLQIVGGVLIVGGSIATGGGLAAAVGVVSGVYCIIDGI